MFIFEFKKVTTGQILTSYTCLKILLTKDNYAFSQRTFGNSFVSLFLTKLACLFQLLLVHFVFYFMICETVYHLHKGQVRHSYDEALLRWKSIFLCEKVVFVGKPSEKAKVFSRPIRMFRQYFEGELRQRCSCTGSFRQCSLSLFISRRTFLFFADFVIYFSNIYTAFQVSMLISNKKSSKHENLNVTLFAARLHYDTFQSERHLKDLLTRHWSLKQRATKLKIKLNSFDGTKMSI